MNSQIYLYKKIVWLLVRSRFWINNQSFRSEASWEHLCLFHESLLNVLRSKRPIRVFCFPTIVFEALDSYSGYTHPSRRVLTSRWDAARLAMSSPGWCWRREDRSSFLFVCLFVQNAPPIGRGASSRTAAESWSVGVKPDSDPKWIIRCVLTRLWCAPGRPAVDRAGARARRI